MIKSIEAEAKKFFSNSRGSHDWEHTLRVYNLCLHIGKEERADMEILEIAALLHDIGREEQDKCNGVVCHAERGAELAEEMLTDLGVSEEKIERIIHCIRAHRFRKGESPKSKEAKILFDADKLDSIGAVGVGRAFLFAGEIGAKLHDKNIDIEKTKEYSKDDTAYREYMLKRRRVKEKILTKEGKRLAEERHKFMVEYFNRLNKEVEGIL